MTPAGCTSWSQQGSVSESTSCFPGDASVLTPLGPVRLDQLQIGDMVLGYDASEGKDVFTPVRAWLHRMPETPNEFIKLQTQHGELEVSRLHNVAIMSESGDIDYQYAQEVAKGSSLKGRDGPIELVATSEGAVRKGLFSPLTRMSNFYVASNSSSVMFLAHSFAHIRIPALLGPVYQGIMSVAEFWNPKVHEVNSSEEYIHPVARWCQDTFSFLLDKSARPVAPQLSALVSTKSYQF